MTEMNGRRRLQPSIRALAQVAVIGVYLETLFYVVPRDWVGYKFIHLLFDYKHGPARRSLEGEILRHLVAPPYSVGFFHWFANLQLLAAILLFMLVTWMIAAARDPPLVSSWRCSLSPARPHSRTSCSTRGGRISWA